MVFEEVKKLAIDPEAIKNIKDSHEEVDNTAEIELIKGQIKELDGRLSKMIDLFSIGQIDITMVENKTAEIQDEKLRLTRELEHLQYTNNQSVSEIQNLAVDLTNIIDSGDDDAICSILHQLIDKIIINDEDIIIHWKFA